MAIPLIGATILEAGTSSGTVTDIDGGFAMTLSEGAKQLRISYTGFITKNVPVTNVTSYEIILAESSSTLDEVVVIGYGSTSKRFLTDNVVKLSSEDIDKVPVANFQSTFAGKAAGVRVTQTNGKVDAGINIRVRGASSVSAGSQPLYVLDGVPLINQNESQNGAPTNPLLSLSPSEIESIDILKDASSAAIYGARGANGVVLITTKRGKIGKARMNLNVSTGTSSPTNLVEFLNAEEYVELLTEASVNGGEEARVIRTLDAISNGTDWRNGEVDTDWNDEAFRSGSQTNANFSVSGGDEKTIYYFGGAYNDTEGILLGNALERFSARTNLKHNFTDRFSAGLNLGYSTTTIDRIANDNAFVNPIQAIAQAPISPARLADGTPYAGTVYPNFLLELDFGNYVTKLRRLTGKAYGQYKILDGLSFNTDFGYDMSYQTEDQFRGSRTPFQATNGQVRNSNSVQESYVFTNYLTYERDLTEKHNINLVAGTEFNQADRFFNSVTGNEFPSDDFQTINSAAEITEGLGVRSSYAFFSYFGRAQYVYDGRYFVKGSIRRDGSSRFGANSRYGIFPAGSIGWIVSQEPWLQNNPTLSFLKLRLSYGQLGNSEIGNFPSLFLFQGTSYNQRSGIQPTQPGNNDLTWETSTQLDLGLEFGLLDSRLSGEIDFYNKRTEGLLFEVPLPGSSGATAINQNIGILDNRGVEFVLNADLINSDGFVWNANFNAARNFNELVELPNNNADVIFSQNINRVGEPISAHYLPEYAGVDPENGDALYFINGDGEDAGETTNSVNEANRKVVGNPFPDWTAGFTNTISYRGVTLNFTFMGEWGASVYNGGGRFQSANGDFYDNQTVDQLNRWQNPGDITDVPEARFFGGNGTANSTRYLDRADFIRLRNLTLSYDLPRLFNDKVGLSDTQIYFTGINLLTFTDFPGYDPESRNDSNDDLSTGQSFYSAPAAKTVSVGINVNF
ncbi:SusC/RagA family TonB-linked outer membrane protein [Neolewinella antarctica]|uniref:TonB-linked SusC/RagA family outer membrane protein n=1 Tax=Neolewinella antarctica TaxID=442734 RepID=A0ABX0XGI6_9BACT|nr:TonB-dependent receptor [Neolewinella antarctica]NJC28448.1 TonB-linked SusC/RagA family outer membrane protein [Neolewinella antarctica]